MSLHRDRGACGGRHVLISNRWLDNVRYSPLTQHFRIDAEDSRSRCWTDALTDLCGQFDVDPLEASSFEGRINYTTVSRLKLCQIEASQHRIAHTVSRAKLSEHPFVKILFQTYGVSYFEQDGRRIDVMPGDCLAYDVSCPHTIVSPALTRHEVVIVPKELLQERGFRFAKMSAVQAFGAHRHRPHRP